MRRSLLLVLASLALMGAALMARPMPAAASPLTTSPITGHQSVLIAASRADLITPSGPAAPSSPAGPKSPGPAGGTTSITIDPKPSTSVSILLLLTVMSIAPSILLLMTSFTKIFVVLGLARNALGLNGVPPNQVLAGLSLFLTMFIMSPVLKLVNSQGIQPYLKGTKPQRQAFNDGIAPLKTFMLHHTRPEEIALMLRAGHLPNPATTDKLDLTTLIPAFVLSELRAAMIIGFVIYIPFLIIDMVVASSLMSLGMMMLPPVSVSLPFKLLLFVLVDGWGLIINALITSYHTG